MSTAEPETFTSYAFVMALIYATVLGGGLWFLGALALRRIGPWKGDPRTWKLAGLLVGCGFCLLFVFLFTLAFAFQDGVTSNLRARICFAVAVLGSLTLGLLAYRLDRDIRHPKSPPERKVLLLKVIGLFVLGFASIAVGLGLCLEQVYQDGFWPVPFGIVYLLLGGFVWGLGVRARFRLVERRPAA